VVGINRSDQPQLLQGLDAVAYQELLGSTTVTGPSLSIPARSSVILTTAAP
jgi:hypothetical protein